MVGREDTGGGGYYGDSIYNDYYASGTAATSWRPNGKSSNALPYDSGYALENLPANLPVIVQSPDGTTRALSMPEQVPNSVTASASAISGAAPPPQ